MVFPKFWFESNQAFDTIDSLEKLEWLVKTCQTGWNESRSETIRVLSQSRQFERTRRNIPEYGRYAEHRGSRTLGEYLDEHGIEWPAETS